VDTAPYPRYRDMKFGKNFSRNYGKEVTKGVVEINTLPPKLNC